MHVREHTGSRHVFMEACITRLAWDGASSHMLTQEHCAAIAPSQIKLEMSGFSLERSGQE